MNRLTLPLLAASLGLFAACATPSVDIDVPTKMRSENLIHQGLAEELAPNLDAILSYIELPPHGIVPPHWHPGEEFAYWLSGSGTIRFKDGTTIECTPGKSGHVPHKAIHWAKAGPQGGKVLVFRVHSKGKEIRYPAKTQ